VDQTVTATNNQSFGAFVDGSSYQRSGGLGIVAGQVDDRGVMLGKQSPNVIDFGSSGAGSSGWVGQKMNSGHVESDASSSGAVSEIRTASGVRATSGASDMGART
jgi:hypothetical protein